MACIHEAGGDFVDGFLDTTGDERIDDVLKERRELCRLPFSVDKHRFSVCFRRSHLLERCPDEIEAPDPRERDQRLRPEGDPWLLTGVRARARFRTAL